MTKPERLSGKRLDSMLACCCECAHYPNLERCPACEARSRIAALEAELAEARRWKTEALEVESEWDDQAVGKLLGLRPGASIRASIQPGIERLIKERDEARAQEREACAVEADLRAKVFGGEPTTANEQAIAEHIAAAIRARKGDGE